MKELIRRHLRLIERPNIPPAFAVLELWGLSNADVAFYVKRSPHQVTYYREGKTQVPPDVQRRLFRLLVDCYEFSAGHRHVLVQALRTHTNHVIDQEQERWKLKRPKTDGFSQSTDGR